MQAEKPAPPLSLLFAALPLACSKPIALGHNLSSGGLDERVRGKVDRIEDLEFRFEKKIQDAANITISKDDKEPSSRIVVRLTPLKHKFSQYIAKVLDMSEDNVKDAVRTFLASGTNAALINIHNLHPGHHYKYLFKEVMLLGRKDNTTTVVKEQDVMMDPQAPNFSSRGASIIATETNITLKTNLIDKALQDSFLIRYRQVSPDEAFAPIELSNVDGQKQLELFLNRLNPGHDYDVAVVAVKGGVNSKPWHDVLTTKPSKIASLTAVDALPNCINLTWMLPPESGVDHFEIAYGPPGGDVQKESAASSTRSFSACDGLAPGMAALFSVTVVKSSAASSPVTVEHVLRPRPPTAFNIRPDTWSSKYRIWADVPAEGRIDGCALSVVSETLDRLEMTEKVDANKTSCEFLLPLKPGERYELSVQTTSLSTRSTKVQRSLALPPAFDMTAFGLSVQEARGGLEIAWPVSDLFIEKLKQLWSKVVGSDSVLHARLSQPSRNETRQFETSPYTLKPIFISNLTQGQCYKVQLYTVTKSGIVSDARFDESIRISPPPIDVTLHSVSKTVASIRLSLISQKNFTQPECQTLLVVTDENGLAVFDRHLPLGAPTSDIPLDGLRPFHKYLATTQDRPGPVQNATVASINSFSARLSWLPPSLPNGIVTHYVVNIQPESGEPWSVNVGAGAGKQVHSKDAVVDGLRGGMNYSFLIRAVTEAGMGDPPAVSDAPRLMMPIHAPPRPSSSPFVVAQSVRPHTVVLTLPSSLFDTRNGPIIRFSVLVSEVVEGSDIRIEDQVNSSSFTWSEVQPFHHWPAYTTVVVDTGGHSPPPTTMILRSSLHDDDAVHRHTALGDHHHWLDRGSETAAASAWILLISITLLFSVLLGIVCLILCNTGGKPDKRPFSDTSSASKESQWRALRAIMTDRAAECLAKLGLEHPAESEQAHAPTQMAMVHPRSPIGRVMVDGGAPSSCGNAAPTPRRTGSLRERTGVDHTLDSLPCMPGRPLLSTILPGADTKRSRPVPLERFAEHVRLMSADTGFRFAEEYELFKNVGVGPSHSAADLPPNRLKNRFTNVLPFDHSRVKLRARDDDCTGEDYINASYIPGAFSRREFIACQGPMVTTRDDFWRMILEQQVPIIVALTKCFEKGKLKCELYWPDKNNLSLLYGDIEVTLLSETESADLAIREFRLTPLSNPAAARTITHLHYTTWPDFSVPETPHGILRLIQIFRRKLPHDASNKPVVVHCSAGVGRSGTFIALDRLLVDLERGRPLDPFGTVCEMRMERTQMVQSEINSRVPVVSLLLALSLLLTHHWAFPWDVLPARVMDPAQFDWAQCERLASCYVPGKCIGRIEGLLNISRRPFDNCTVGIIMEIKSADEIELTIVTEVQAKTINLNWLSLKPAYTCHATDTDEKSVTNSRSTATITNYVPIKSAKGMKCIFGIKHLGGAPLRDSLFVGTIYNSTFELEIIDSEGKRNLSRKTTTHLGYAIDARNGEQELRKMKYPFFSEMQFRVPDSSTNWTVCSDEDKACLTSGKCDGGPETQLRVPEDQIDTCNNGVIAEIISKSEWQITIYVEADGEIKDKVMLGWLGMSLFSCNTTDNNQEIVISAQLKGWIRSFFPYSSVDLEIIRHIPYYDSAKNLIKCTFTILSYINESTQQIKESSKKVLNFLFDDAKNDSVTILNYEIKDSNLEDKKVFFIGYIDDVKAAMTDKMKFDGRKCVGCEKAKQTGDTVVYTPGPCEQYKCANSKAKMSVNNRFMREEMLKCVNSEWKLKKTEKENGNEQFIDIETLESVTCAEMAIFCKTLQIDIAQRPFSPACDKGFSLVFFPFKKTKRDPVNITSIRCDETEALWELFIDHTSMLKMTEGGTVVCIVDGYDLPKFNALTGAQEPNRKEESNVALKVSLYTLAVIFAIAIILIVAFFIIIKIKTRQETPDDLPEGTPVIHPKPILTVHKMEAKRKVSLVVT
ncbi:dep-1 [Pristionchus pacificus]|uniref:protein-tyrosine-phosphatase n=1 Tax=Pristionchus pacificus TaxID=54126 RepID=A0A2A6CW35_PRIPA|nr:dep-1 [Pristionchus pacificus]|eukprot:PDM82442.1 dep-1 [Pristionchus pacificus]